MFEQEKDPGNSVETVEVETPVILEDRHQNLLVLAADLNESLSREAVDFLLHYRHLISACRSGENITDALRAATEFDLPEPLDPDNRYTFTETDTPRWEELNEILARIPLYWGRYLSVGEGWYPIVIEAEEQLEELFPNHIVQQIKEKFGQLRIYWEPGRAYNFFSRVVPRPEPPEALREPYENYTPNLYSIQNTEDPSPELRAWFRELEAWYEKEALWNAHPDNILVKTETRKRYEAALEVIREAEKRASKTCELTGDPGVLARNPRGWIRTLSPEAIKQENAEPLVREKDFVLSEILIKEGLLKDKEEAGDLDYKSKEVIDVLIKTIVNSGVDVVSVRIKSDIANVDKAGLQEAIRDAMPPTFSISSQILGEGLGETVVVVE